MTQYLDRHTINRLRRSKRYLSKHGKTKENIEIAMSIIVIPGGTLPRQRQFLTDQILPRLYAFAGLKRRRG